jgi:septin 7
LAKHHFRCFKYKFLISDFLQPGMTFDLVYHVRARARSLQLDKTALTPAMVALEQVAAQASATKRLSSLPDGQTPSVQFSVPSFVPAAIRRYRSMLEVEEPPKLGPWNPMSFEELYSGPVESAAVSDGDILSSDRSTRSCSWNTNPPNTVESQETELSSQMPSA